MPVKDSFAGLALKDGQPLLVNNPASQMQAYHRNPDLKSLLVIPLYVEGMSIGVINVVNKPGGFANDDIRIMSLFAVQAAIAIENARLHHQAEQLAVVNERQRLARDLHDSVTQTLYSLSLFADATQKALQKNKVTKALDHLGELRKLTREAMLDMRLLIFELYPPVLQKEGLATALQTRLESVEARSGIRTEYHVVNERRLPLETETELFRIAQETLTNVVKHAQAEYLRVSMHYEPNQIRLKIEDNGIGFDLKRASKGGGFGLKGILERAQRINGQLHIESSLNNGTIVEVVVKI
jgi:signal transduction histidine kinase